MLPPSFLPGLLPRLFALMHSVFGRLRQVVPLYPRPCDVVVVGAQAAGEGCVGVITVVAQQLPGFSWRVSHPRNIMLFGAFLSKATVGLQCLLLALTIANLVSGPVGS